MLEPISAIVVLTIAVKCKGIDYVPAGTLLLIGVLTLNIFLVIATLIGFSMKNK